VEVADELTADAAQVDALDERPVDEHLRSVVGRAGRVDISFNAIGITDADVVGVRSSTWIRARASGRPRRRPAAEPDGDPWYTMFEADKIAEFQLR
jgi:hypothetical protein